MTDPKKLMERLAAYLKDSPHRGDTYHPMHPDTLIAEALEALSAPVTDPGDEARAREILAAQYQRDDHKRAESILMGFRDKRAVDAVASALAFADDTPTCAGEVERLREALVTIAEGEEPRPVGKRWRADEKSSKNDKCIHDVWMYDTCGQCISDCASAALAALSLKDVAGEAINIGSPT